MKFYIVKNDVQQGPFEVTELVIQGLAPDTLVWTKGMPEWVEASTVPELAQAIIRPNDDPGIPPAIPVREPAAPPAAPPAMPAAAPAPEAPEPSGNNRATRALLGILIGVVIIAVLMFTKPSRERHLSAISTACVEYLCDEVDDSPLAISSTVAEGAKDAGRAAIEGYLDYHLSVDDYFVFNVSKVGVGTRSRTASVGVLGMVFTFDKDDVAEAVAKRLGSKSVTDHVVDQVGNAIDRALGPSEAQPAQQPDSLSISQKLDSVSRSVANKVVDKVTEKGKEMVNDAVDQLLEQIGN